MPSRKKERYCSKRNTYISNTSTRRQKRGWGCRNKISSGQLKDLNEMVHNYTSKGTWKVVPKDSLEVHKNRRKRQIDDERKREENKNDKDDRDRKNDNKERRSYRRISRRRKRYNSRRQESESSSSCSTLSCCTSCANRMDYE